jgi:tRNA(fMet)-specific endonuclease VapC
MIRLLDTNTCVYYLNRSSEKLISQFKKFSPSQIKLSSITVAELFYGAEKSHAKKKNWATVESFVSTLEIIPFDFESSRMFATIKTSLERAGTPIGPMDLLIASISLSNNYVLVTNNTSEFRRVKKLKLENWL